MTQERVSFILQCNLNWNGFSIEWQDNLIYYYDEGDKNALFQKIYKSYDYVGFFVELDKMFPPRSKAGRLIRPALEYAENNHIPVYINGVRCTELEDEEVS